MNVVLVVRQSGQQQIEKISLTAESPVTIGRGWDNHVVVDDAYIDASHLQFSLDEQGRFCVEDLATQNGTQINRHRVSGSTPCESGTTIRFGDSTVTVFDENSPVMPALKRDLSHSFLNRFDSFSGLVFSLLIAAMALLFSNYVLSYMEATGEKNFSDILTLALFVGGWSLLAGFVGKLFRHETNIKLHIVHVCLLTAVSIMLIFVFDLIGFNFDSALIGAFASYAAICALITTFIYVTLTLCTRFSKTKRVAAASMMGFLIAAYTLVEPMLKEDHESWSYTPQDHQISQPPMLFFGQSTTLDEHIQTTDLLFVQLDREVRASASEDLEQGIITNPIQISVID